MWKAEFGVEDFQPRTTRTSTNEEFWERISHGARGGRSAHGGEENAEGGIRNRRDGVHAAKNRR